MQVKSSLFDIHHLMGTSSKTLFLLVGCILHIGLLIILNMCVKLDILTVGLQYIPTLYRELEDNFVQILKLNKNMILLQILIFTAVAKMIRTLVFPAKKWF